MSNLIEIQIQIEKLQKQADEIKSREFDNIVEEIRAQMQAFGITIKDLQAGKGRGKSKAAKAKATKGVVSVAAKKNRAVVAAKYRGPNGETWSGRGLTPKWLTALIAQGQSKESFAINA
jgi:DNA-binding protein H-NS